MAPHRLLAPMLLVLASAFTAAHGMPRFSNEDLEMRRRELISAEMVGGVDHYESLMKASGMISTQGNEAIFGCASVNITTLPRTLLTPASSPQSPGYRLDLYAYVLCKFNQVQIRPTWVALARGAMYSPESTEILLNVSGTWLSTSYATSPDVKQSFYFTSSFMDTAGFPTSGFGETEHDNGLTLTTSLADAIPYFKLQTAKHYFIMGTSSFPSGALRGQAQKWLNGLPLLCGIQ